jgi:hypothetical protein
MNDPVYAEFYLSAVFAQYMDAAAFYFKADAGDNFFMFEEFNYFSLLQNRTLLYS